MRTLDLQRMKVLTVGLTLVRHGETQFNKDGVLQGQTIDAALSEVGLQQAEAAGRYLQDVAFSHVVVSDLLRAKQTAEAIVKLNRLSAGLQTVCEPLLKEINFGVAEGRRLQEVREMARAAGQSFPGFTPPEGETPEQVTQRVKGFLENLLLLIGAEHWPEGGDTAAEASPVEGKADDGVHGVPVHALVVTHGAYMCRALRYFVEELRCAEPAGSDRDHMFSLSPNAGLSRFLLTVHRQDAAVRVSGISCVFVHRGEHVRP